MKRFLSILLAVVVLVMAGFAVVRANQTIKLDTKNYVQSTTPTLFFHGYGSSANAEKHMTNAAVKAGVTQTVIRADVDRDGKVILTGEIPKGAINPIVQVQYADNRNPAKTGQYAKAVVDKLQSTYGFKKMNMVGHSMGNMSILNYMLEHSTDETAPQLQKQVDIANHVAGLEGMNLPEGLTLNPETGEPNKMNADYQRFLGLREIYPEYQVDVLNIYGDTGGETDGSVKNVSSLALKYLLQERAKSYREVKFTGPKAQHSQLHENDEVDKLLINFLWGK